METLFMALLFTILMFDLIVSSIAHLNVAENLVFLKKLKAKMTSRNQAIIAGVNTNSSLEELFQVTIFESKEKKLPRVFSSFSTKVEKEDLVTILSSEIKDKKSFIHDLIFEKENKYLFTVNSLILVQKFIKEIYLYLGFLFSSIYLIKAYAVFLNSTESVYLYGESVIEQFSLNIIMAVKWFSISILAHLIALGKWRMANYSEQAHNLLKKIESLIASTPDQEK